MENKKEANREEIKAAISKAVKLRALMQGNFPANKFPIYPSSASSVSGSVPQFSAQDYPVFTPSYEDEPLPAYPQILTRSPTLSESWDECAVIETSPGKESSKARGRNSLGDFNSVSSCNRRRPAVITAESENPIRSTNHSHSMVPLTDTNLCAQPQPKSRGVISWLLPRLKKKQKNECSPNRTESEEVSQLYKDLGVFSVEALKQELIESNEKRNAALTEVAEMKGSFGELKKKLEQLETYCGELKKALRKATQVKDSQMCEKHGKFLRGKSVDGTGGSLMSVSEEVMVEGFLQIVSEARLSVKEFCKTLVGEIEETDKSLNDGLNSILQQYKLSLSSKNSKSVLYYLEAIINQTLYQDFENSVFQKNGSQRILDPQQDRETQFSSFIALKNISWNEVLRKGTKHYSEEFSRFCDQKMSLIITILKRSRPWPEQVLQTFFVAAKRIWLLHLLAFSFHPPLSILRVEENRPFEAQYMEDIFADRQRSQGPSRVKIMIMPGFYVQSRVLKCKVICRYKSVA